MNISIIIPAAGLSKRNPGKLLKTIKHTLQDKHQTVLETTVSKFIDFEINIIVVVGHDKTRITRLLRTAFSNRITIVENIEYKSGMGSSLTTGVSALPSNTDYFGFCLADKPFIQESTINTLLDSLKKDKPNILVPTFNDNIGHPNFFTIDYKTYFLNLNEDIGGKSLIKQEKNNVMTLPISDKGIITDMDEYILSAT